VDLTGKFLIPSTLGDVLKIESTILELRRSSFSVRHRASKDNELRAESMDTRVWVRRSADDPGKIEALALPAKLVERFQAGGMT
jgi:4-hydroxybenzoyl-CoA thioesterase